MSAGQSSLSSTGFDYVVAVTQDSINAALEEYLFSGLPEVILCYVYDESVPPNPVPADYATLVAQADNTDPFAVPDGTPPDDPRVMKLSDAGFAFAVKAELGLPPGVPPASLPPIVTLKPGQSNVTYTLMFAEFAATEILYGPRNSVTWVNKSQPAGRSWTFSGTVDLDFQEKAFAELPLPVQNRLKDIGDPAMFSVSQLYYDLNSSALVQNFQFDTPSNDVLSRFMTEDFVNTYFKNLKDAEVLGYGARQLTATPPSSLAVTDLNFFTPDAAGPAGAPLALNYLCAANHHALPPTTHAGFGWNWVEPGEVSQYDGVAAVNRNTLASYLGHAILPDGRTLLEYAASNCYLPSVRVTYLGGDHLQVKYEFSASPGQAPAVTYPASGSTLISCAYDSGAASDQAGLDGDMGRADLSSTFGMTVSVQGNQIVIVQHLVIWTYVRYLATSDSGNIVDLELTDTYTIGVDEAGRLAAALQSSARADNSRRPGANGFLNFFADVDTLSDKVSEWAGNFAATNFTDVPVSFVQNFIFPGGATFSFTDASFSDSQDLVSHITYADASRVSF